MSTLFARPRPRRLRPRAVPAFARRPGRAAAGRLPVWGALLTTLILTLPLAALLVYAAPSAAAPTVHPVSPVTRRWVPPVQPLRVVRPFQPPPAPWAAGHRGVDLALAPHGRVVSAGAGTVTVAGLVAGRGVVVVQTGDLRTTYEPVSPSVRVGQVVRPGDPLGTVAGRTHCAPEVCLHWGLLRGQTYLDPLTLLSRPSVRLLPLDGPVVVVNAARLGGVRLAPRRNGVAPVRLPSTPTEHGPSPRAGTPPTPVAVAALILSGGAYVAKWASDRHSRASQPRGRPRSRPRGSA